MRYAFSFTTTVNVHGVFFLIFFMKSEGTCTCILLCFSNFIYFGSKLQVYNFIYMALHSL